MDDWDPIPLSHLSQAGYCLRRAALLANERQFDCAHRAWVLLKEAISTLEGGYPLDAVDVSVDSVAGALLELTGERVTDAVVDQVFSRFCVGK